MDVSNALNIAISTTIKRYREKEGIELDDVAARLGITPYVFRNKACPTNTEHHFRSDQLFSLVKLTGDTTIARVFEKVANGQDSDVSAETIIAILLDIGIDQGKAQEVIKEAIEDGEVTATELRGAMLAISQCIENYKNLDQAIIQMAGQ